ncbi:hypothetical protein PFISCL1PPCAC_129 [Pristionchus fissidentatus]|uniref:IST1 homolog n=1 Tax=Pristionchus fissidentatus TaxID=1538716 RepID=A0AAV5URE9_9BILA|nr:hypothetical protein PFISCL1PPCAC_129 [Pristionchus fissidentatus]
MSISWGAQYPKLKTNLRLATNRLKLMEKKKTEMALKARTEIADFISAQKPDRARIRVEHIIREDFMVEAFELLEMYCDLLLARFGLIEQMKTLDDGIAEAVISILWAAPRVAQDIAEFKTISEQLTVKYGKVLAEAARANQLEYPAKVNPKLMAKLNVSAPPRLLVEKYLIHIAQAAGVPFKPDPDVMREDEVAQAEALLIEFKKNEEIQGGGHGLPPFVPPPMSSGPPPPGGPPPPPGGGYGGPPPPPGGYGGGGGGGSMMGVAPPFQPPPAPPGDGGSHQQHFPPPPGSFPPPPPYGGSGGGGMSSDIYEVPGSRKYSGPVYDEVSNQSPISTPTIPTSGFVQLPRIGPDGRPVDPNALPGAGQYPILSARCLATTVTRWTTVTMLLMSRRKTSSILHDKEHTHKEKKKDKCTCKRSNSASAKPKNSMVDPKPKTSAPSAPIVQDEKDDLADLFPEPPSSMPSGHGGNNGGSGGGGLDLDDLTRRFDALKKK